MKDHVFFSEQNNVMDLLINGANPSGFAMNTFSQPRKTGGTFDKLQGIEPLLLSPATCFTFR
ncbi:MAG TPA: hypothetical protein PLV78_04365 [Deltaproteobacteria bacterium]|nr:hypothetical protein [Deltaproteobacteria bacterium]